MNIPINVYLTVLTIGSVVLFLLTRLKMFREWFSSLLYNKIFFITTISIFILLFWPLDPGTAFQAGDSLGYMRIVRIAVFVALFFWFSLYALRFTLFPKFSGLYIYGVYIIICVFSTIYSPNWQETAWKSFELVVLWLFALVVRKEIWRGKVTPEQIVQAFSYIIFATVVFSIVGGVLYPDISYAIQTKNWEYQFRCMGGIIPQINPNSLGQLSSMTAFLGFFALFIQGRLKPEALILLLFGTIGMVFAYARTAIFAFAALVIIFSTIRGRGLGWFTVFIAMFVCLLGLEYIMQYVARGQNAQQFVSMSGRTYMWNIAWDEFRNEPWLGKGFYAGHKTLDIKLGMEYSSIDNTYLESLVNVGLVGTVFLILFVLTTLKRAIVLVMHSRNQRSPTFWGISVGTGYLFLMFVRSLAGPSFQVLHFNLLMLLVLTIMLEKFTVGVSKTPTVAAPNFLI